MKRSLGWMFGLCLLFFFQSTLANAMQTPVKTLTPVTEYSNVTLKELVSVYEHAYVGQGFHVRTHTREVTPGSIIRVHLILQMVNPAHPKLKVGLVSFWFNSSGQDGGCTPCDVYREMFSAGDFGKKYTDDEYVTFLRYLVVADKRALVDIKRILGKSVPSLNGPAGSSVP